MAARHKKWCVVDSCSAQCNDPDINCPFSTVCHKDPDDPNRNCWKKHMRKCVEHNNIGGPHSKCTPCTIELKAQSKDKDKKDKKDKK